DDVDGTLIGFRFPAATISVNVPGWHFHFLSADRGRGGHCPWPDHRRGSGLARGILRPAHQLARPSPGIERRRGGDQGGGTPAVSFSARARPRRESLSRGAPPPSPRARAPSMPSFCAAPKIGVGRNSVIVRHRAALYKLAPRAGASLSARGCNVFAEEWRRYPRQDQGLSTFRQRALHE